MTYISPTITITSTEGGTVTIPIDINSIPVEPIPVEALQVLIKRLQPAAEVTLDGSTSSGPVNTFLWEQVSGPVDVELSDV